MFTIRTATETVTFTDSPIQTGNTVSRPMSELAGYVASLTTSYSITQEYDYDAATDEYVIRYQDTETGETFERRSTSELTVSRIAGNVASYVNLDFA